MRWLSMAFLFAVAACASSLKDWVPYTPERADPVAFNHDLGICRAEAEAYPRRLDVVDLGSAGLEGTLGALPTAAANVTAPILGGLGQMGDELAAELNLSGHDRKKIVALCLFQKGWQSGKYSVVDPIL